jgi:hypothetical protein
MQLVRPVSAAMAGAAIAQTAKAARESLAKDFMGEFSWCFLGQLGWGQWGVF